MSMVRDHSEGWSDEAERAYYEEAMTEAEQEPPAPQAPPLVWPMQFPEGVLS